MVVLLFASYELFVTDWLSALKQREATADLEDQWSNPRGTIDRPLEGDGIAKLHIPSFGPDFDFTVLQGTGQDVLAVGPGHYVDTAMPGQPGNFALAGHRVGHGSPFNDLDLLESCDALVVETRDTWFVYRMLPTAGEVAGWSTGKGATPQCRGVAPLPPPYPEVPGRKIVMPWQGEVIEPVPGAPESLVPPEQRAPLITLTTCHPRFSAEKRLIIHGVLVGQHPKTGPESGWSPAELVAS
ncbi:MAG: class E sortase [Pseudonocardiaceae bacterium]|nr:class E sortase [Pseudonocardiaceae bacterium]